MRWLQFPSPASSILLCLSPMCLVNWNFFCYVFLKSVAICVFVWRTFPYWQMTARWQAKVSLPFARPQTNSYGACLQGEKEGERKKTRCFVPLAFFSLILKQKVLFPSIHLWRNETHWTENHSFFYSNITCYHLCVPLCVCVCVCVSDTRYRQLKGKSNVIS